MRFETFKFSKAIFLFAFLVLCSNSNIHAQTYYGEYFPTNIINRVYKVQKVNDYRTIAFIRTDGEILPRYEYFIVNNQVSLSSSQPTAFQLAMPYTKGSINPFLGADDIATAIFPSRLYYILYWQFGDFLVANSSPCCYVTVKLLYNDENYVKGIVASVYNPDKGIISFWMVKDDKDLKSSVYSTSELEERMNVVFFPQLPSSIKNKYENLEFNDNYIFP